MDSKAVYMQDSPCRLEEHKKKKNKQEDSVQSGNKELSRRRRVRHRDVKNSRNAMAKTEAASILLKHGSKKAYPPKETVKVIPLGGLEEIGMNMTAFEFRGTIIVVDCGASFPGLEEPGVDIVIPDVSYLKENISRVRGFFITHGHEDHIGAIQFVEREIHAPVYGTKFTLAVIDSRMEQHHVKTRIRKTAVKYGQKVRTGPFTVEFIKTSHSIPDSAALAITTAAGTIIHTGDFKIDRTPVSGDPINLRRFAQLGKKGVLAMLCDSTNAEHKGSTLSESTIGIVLDSLFLKYKEKRILIATFASNIDRIQQIINTAYKKGRKAAVDGKSMVKMISLAESLGYISIPENTLVDMDSLSDYEEKDTVIIMTGSQGEEMSALTRVSKGKHAKITAGENDVVIFSSNPIPGNEKAVNDVINSFMMNGVEVVFQGVHVSGHACANDIQLLYSLVKPQFAVPVHGDFRQRTAQMHIAESLGYKKESIHMLHSGDVLELCSGYAEVTGTVKSGRVLVDKNIVGNIGSIVINERKRLSNDGIVVVVVTLTDKNEIVSGPEVISRGFVYVRGAKLLMDKMRKAADSAVRLSLRMCEKRSLCRPESWDLIKGNIRDGMEEFLWEEVMAKPIILPIIMEA